MLEVDEAYVAGVTSKGYRLAARYQSPFRRTPCEDESVATRIRQRLRVQARSNMRLPVHQHLYGWYRRLEIDVPTARGIAMTIESPGRPARRSKPAVPPSRQPHIHQAAIDMIVNRDLGFSYCAQGRVHTNVTRLSRELRPTLRIAGQPLWNIDVRNSQPLILGLVIGGQRQGTQPLPLSRKFHYRPVNPYLAIPAVNGNGHPSTPATPTNTMSTNVHDEAEPIGETGLTAEGLALHEDERRYLQLCESGVIYEHLQKQSGLSKLDRREIKQRFFQDIFFGRNQAISDFTRLFASEFPNVMAVIRQVKREDHAQRARLMQLFESSLVINNVCGRLMRDYPHVPILTIHDSVMTTPEHVGCVQDVMLEQFERVGLRPQLTVERNLPEESEARAA